jgi:CubicO group peptidase (beta-lactamase class C family)
VSVFELRLHTEGDRTTMAAGIITHSRHLGLAAILLTAPLVQGCEEGTKGDAKPEEMEPPEPDARFDGIAAVAMQTLENSLAKGVSVAVMEKGKLVFAQGFGSASPTELREITPATTFQIGSTTKQLTAMAVLDQVDQGLYALDDTVAEVLPGFSLTSDPEWAKQATVRDLLSHQSGLIDDLPLQGSTADEGLADYLYENFAVNKWAMNPPGVFWNYSNANFDLAGLILEEHDAGGRAYADIVVEDLFTPLGMTRSYGRVSDARKAGRYADSTGEDAAAGHIGLFPDFSFGEPRAQTIDELSDLAANRPAGGSTFSTPSDMCRWGYFVLHGNRAVLSDEAREQLTTAQAPTLWNDAMHYGLGTFVWDEFPLSGNPFGDASYREMEVWEHGGNTLTFTSSLVIAPEHDVIVSILSNGAGTDHGALQAALLKAVLDPLPKENVRAPSVDATKLASLAGTYRDEHVAGDIIIREGGTNGLTIDVPSFEDRGFPVAADLSPLSTYTWFAMAGEIPFDITFVVGENGKPTPYLRSRHFVAERVAP